MIYFLTAVVTGSIYLLARHIDELEKKRIERQAIFEKWIFESLYSINHKVVLPEVHEKKTINRPAKVYSPSEDPMSEFTGEMDDL